MIEIYAILGVALALIGLATYAKIQSLNAKNAKQEAVFHKQKAEEATQEAAQVNETAQAVVEVQTELHKTQIADQIAIDAGKRDHFSTSEF